MRTLASGICWNRCAVWGRRRCGIRASTQRICLLVDGGRLLGSRNARGGQKFSVDDPLRMTSAFLNCDYMLTAPPLACAYAVLLEVYSVAQAKLASLAPAHFVKSHRSESNFKEGRGNQSKESRMEGASFLKNSILNDETSFYLLARLFVACSYRNTFVG